MISKPNISVSNLHFIICSNEYTTPIVKLALLYFDKFIGLNNINITVISNKYTSELPYSDKVNYVAGNLEFDGSGKHFGPNVKAALEIIKENYIFLFCEDYMLTGNIDVSKLNNLITMMKEENVDLVSFASYFNKRQQFNYEHFKEGANYGFNEDDFLFHKEKHLHVFSVQPCIWKRTSLQEVIKHNPDLALHHLDTSNIKDKKGNYRVYEGAKGIFGYSEWPDESAKYNFKMLCTNYDIGDVNNPPQPFIISYLEMVGRGKIITWLGSVNWAQIIINKIIEENNLKTNPIYDRYF